jgi:hypothetical protein
MERPEFPKIDKNYVTSIHSPIVLQMDEIMAGINDEARKHSCKTNTQQL